MPDLSSSAYCLYNFIFKKRKRDNSPSVLLFWGGEGDGENEIDVLYCNTEKQNPKPMSNSWIYILPGVRLEETLHSISLQWIRFDNNNWLTEWRKYHMEWCTHKCFVKSKGLQEYFLLLSSHVHIKLLQACNLKVQSVIVTVMSFALSYQ